MDETPRMTAAEADARFDALVSDYRRERERGKRGRKQRGRDEQPVAAGLPARKEQPATRAATGASNGTLVVVIVFCLGIACGAIWPGKPLTALLVGVPLLLIGRALVGRWRRDGGDRTDG